MKRVIVYVEGASDKSALAALLAPLIAAKRQAGVAIEFFECPRGDRKKSLLLKVPVKAAAILSNDPDSTVVALPDLYPKNRGFAHETVEELRTGVAEIFRRYLIKRDGAVDERLAARFHIHCLKHDLEALLLAAKRETAARLGRDALPVTWTVPVEDQDHDQPPKRVVERLFGDNGQAYVDTVDAPAILGMADHAALAEACPQCFGPFVALLTSINA